MRAYLSIFIFWFIITNSLAQTHSNYKINGRINVDTGSITLNYLVDSAFYPKEFKQQTVKIKNGRFQFEGSLPYPQGVNLTCGARFWTEGFVIEKGPQDVVCNIDSSKKVPIVSNVAMLEYQNQFRPFTGNLNRVRHKLDMQWDSLKRVYKGNVPSDARLPYMQALTASYAQSDKQLLEYVQQHPNSYFAFWRFVRTSIFGYENVLDSIYHTFSPAIRNTLAGKVLGERLKISGSLTAVGKPFPILKAFGLDGIPFDHNFYKKAKYTLIDFWYINCGPCRAQFQDLKNIYKEYHSQGLEIIGVSIDKTRLKQSLKDVITETELSWPQYWDENGVEAKRLYVSKFPTNFLVDDKGMVIKKDLMPEELKAFLKRQMP